MPLAHIQWASRFGFSFAKLLLASSLLGRMRLVMPLSEDALTELNKWLDQADNELWRRQEERRRTRTTISLTAVGVLLAVVSAFGGPALVETMTNSAVDAAAKRVTEEISEETTTLEARAKKALADAEVASKVVVEQSARAERDAKAALEQAHIANKKVLELIDVLEQKAGDLSKELASIDADSKNMRAELQLSVSTLRQQIVVLSKFNNKTEQISAIQETIEEPLEKFKINSDYSIILILANEDGIGINSTISDIQPKKFSEIADMYRSEGYKVQITDGENSTTPSMIAEKPGREIYAYIYCDSDLETESKSVADLFMNKYPESYVVREIGKSGLSNSFIIYVTISS